MGEGWETVHGSKSTWDQVVSGSTNYENTKAKVDFNSMIDYYVIEGFSCNVSWGHNEDMFWVPNGKWRWLTTDIDRDWEYNGQYSDVSTDIIHKKGGGLSGAFIVESEIFGNLMKNTEFKNHFCQRYMAHMSSTLKAARLTRIIDSLVTMLTTEMSSEISKWSSQGGIKSMTAWNSEISNMKKFCTERGDYEITHLGTDMTGGTAKLTINATNAKAGDIYIEGVRMSEGLTGLTFFKGAPLALKAVPKQSCSFKGWGSGGAGDSISITLSGDQTLTATFEGTPPQGVISNAPDNVVSSCSEKINSIKGHKTLSIEVSSPTPVHVMITLFNISGRKLETIGSDIGPDMHPINMSLSALAPGVYFYRVQSKAMDRLNRITLR
jgi:hypothetical protein